MNYPKYLTPSLYFRIFSIEELDYVSKGYYVVRRSAKSTKTETFDHLGLLKCDSLIGVDIESHKPKLREIPGLSKNILGGFFRVKHLIFKPSMASSRDWNGLDALPTFKEIVTGIIKFDENPIPIYFLISKIHKQDFPFNKQIDKEYKKKLPPQFKTLQGTTFLDAQTEVLHKPTVSNFWHVEFHIKDKQTGEYFLSKNVSSESDNVSIDQQKAGTQVAKRALENILMTAGIDFHKKVALIPPYVYIKPIYLIFNRAKKLVQKLQGK